jgi:hypothetical protein
MGQAAVIATGDVDDGGFIVKADFHSAENIARSTFSTPFFRSLSFELQ